MTLNDEIFSAEYVLGLLDEADSARAEARAAREPGFAGLLQQWEEDLVATLAGPTDYLAPAHVLDEVRARLFGIPAEPAASGFPWGRIIGGILAFKIGAISLVLGWNAWFTMRTAVATPFGPAEVVWHMRQGRVRLDHAGPETLQIWIEEDGGPRYLGSEGDWIDAHLSEGDTLLLGQGRPATPSGPTVRVVLGAPSTTSD